MEFVGVLPPDAPDPRLARAEMLKRMPIPVIQLVGQANVEVTDISVMSGSDHLGYSELTASVNATLWRNPDDKSDPVNLADLDEPMRRAIDEVPPWPRPAWLIEQVERMRYPLLWEAVQTTWRREESEYSTLEECLANHVNYVLMNQFHEELGIQIDDWESPALTSASATRRGVALTLDGAEVVGAEIDTDPFVYAVGAKLPSGGTLTAVLPRDHLPYIDLRFSSHP
ncbi:hypothetical protein [Mycetocola zhujimingii]|uniref:Uncharacterized protein n=1 Tax=Mycetocola zhujimingii TaxID=2079792 RepID=A0A2U1TE45_9MICO|nr:hypothetical protein [Mycetocola zhujimingii]PWC07161.1 hypothetical protein DF223_07725 [Mycetocola zhujimingii]